MSPQSTFILWEKHLVSLFFHIVIHIFIRFYLINNSGNKFVSNRCCPLILNLTPFSITLLN